MIGAAPRPAGPRWARPRGRAGRALRHFSVGTHIHHHTSERALGPAISELLG